MKATRLKVEYLNAPIGIDVVKPRFFWNCDGGEKQTAYQIICKRAGETVWNSGKVESASMTRISYEGKPLRSRDVTTWAVKLWDEHGNGGEIASSRFEIGLLEASDWKAKWITGNYHVNPTKRYPVDCFRKCFDTADIVKARLYITACGVYEAKLNGQRCGDFILAPGVTDYRKRIQYQTYDVTDLLKDGENRLTVQLADGWYRGSCGAWGLKNQYGTQTKLLAQLEITRKDGSVQTIFSDSSWDWSNDGPIRLADNKDGEIVDANLQPSYSGKAKAASCKVVPTASNNVPVTEHEHLSATKIITPSGKTVLDFGQNIAGYASFRVNAKAGRKLRLRFGEMLDKDGEFTQANIQLSMGKKTTPLQQVEYTCKDGVNEYKTTFAVFGFRYVLVETDFEIDPADFTAIAVYSDLEQVGFFDCSHPLINRLVDATIWSAKGNHLDVPTDCPTRERHAWTGDAQIFFETAGFLFDFAAFSKKYLRDIYDWQRKDGRLPHIVPDGGSDFYMWPMNGSVGWSDIGVLYPSKFRKFYQDDSLMEKYYPGMAKYARFMIRRCGKKMPIFGENIKISKENRKYFVNLGQSYGEWSEPADICVFQWTDFCAPHPEVSTAYTAYIMGIMAEAAEKYGTEEDVKLFREYHTGCKQAYQELITTKAYPLDTDRQARLVRPLALDLLTEDQREFAKKRLISALENYDWRLGTGFLSTPLILDVLSEIDIEAAYRLLENEQIPGWLSMPKLGATTIWESWEGPYNEQGAGAGSLNHYSKGAVCAWFFHTVCGIRPDGENHFTVAPKPGGSLTHAKASYQSIYGKVESKWEKTECGYVFTVTVPANCEAEVYLPDGSKHMQMAGAVSYSVRNDMTFWLAIDIGASSGRHIIGWQENGEIKTKEVYRFPNGIREENGHLVWDVRQLFSNVVTGIMEAFKAYPAIESLSIDTWGVDYVLLKGDEEVSPVYAYRDSRTEAVIPLVHEKMPFSELYRHTGCQFQPFNTIYQLYDEKVNGRMEDVTDMLMMPEYLMWKLCGVKAREYTNATTMGMVNAQTGEFDRSVVERLGYPKHLFPKLSQPRTVLGELRPEIAAAVGGNCKVVLCATHDTGSAVEGIPMEGNHPYISSGTWSLLGVKTPNPITDARSEAANYSNEGGVGYNRYQKNIMGMWLVNELQRELCPNMKFPEIVKLAEESTCDILVDANAPEFFAPKSMKAAFDNATGNALATIGDYFRCAYRSLAISYKQAIEELEANTGTKYEKLYIVGGGAKNAFLNCLTEEATGKKVIALPIEATALGNLKIQMEVK